MQTCSKCGKNYDGHRDKVTRKWLEENAPDVILPPPRTLLTNALVPQEKWPTVEYTCGTICPHCDHAADAPGFVEGDDVPHTCPDGTVICATRYIPPTQVYTKETMI